ncbi:MAG: ABC transporter ATP-binding protein [Pseudomonadota bacterium]
MADLQLHSISKSYGETRVLHELDLTISSGELVALLGPSGCGKTTTLRIVAGFIEPETGSIMLKGKDLSRVAAHKRNVGVVFQAYALFPHMTAAENVAFGLMMRRVGRAERERRTRAALDLVSLSQFGHRYPAQLSGGQQQRVALARALVTEPDVLLLDEPLSNLDAALRSEMRDEISRVRERIHVTTLFVTHDQSEALAMSDSVVVMNHGQIVEQAKPETLSEHPTRVFTADFLGGRSVLAGRRSGASTFDVGLGQDLPILPAHKKHAESGDLTHAVLRAARLKVRPKNSDAPVGDINGIKLPAEVTRSTFLGDQRQITVQVGDATLSVLQASDEPAPEVGSMADLTGPASAISYLSDPRHAPATTQAGGSEPAS